MCTLNIKRTIKLLLFSVLLLSLLLGSLTLSTLISSVHADNTYTVYLWVNGYTPSGEYGDWQKSGASPYLQAVDYPNKYIYNPIDHSITTSIIGWFSFSHMTPPEDAVLVSVSLQIYWRDNTANAQEVCEFILNDGTGTTYTYRYYYSPDTWTWLNITVTSFIDTFTKVNNAKLKIYESTYTGTPDTGDCLIDAVRLEVTYTQVSQTLLVDGFSARNTQWYKVGSSPYLTYVDYPNNYIWGRPSYEGTLDNYYTFQNHSARGTFVRLEYRVYCKYIWSGSNYYATLLLTWRNATSESSNSYTFNSGFDWTWLSGNITVAKSWSDVDNCNLTITLDGFDPTNGQFLIDCVQIVAYYIPAPATWNTCETWYVELAGKLWNIVETWLVNLGTKIWNTIEVWSFILILGEQYSISLMRYGLFFTGLLCIGFSLIGGVKKHDSMMLAIFWILVFFIGIGLLIAVGGM
jgi:hypothetical protein